MKLHPQFTTIQTLSARALTQVNQLHFVLAETATPQPQHQDIENPARVYAHILIRS